MNAWLGVVCADHVARGVRLGMAQTNHGRRAGVARMAPGDWLVYYSPHQTLGRHSPLQAFTAIGQVQEGDIWQADEGTFKPWRRRVRYQPQARSVPLADVRHLLDLTSNPAWGHQLRRGLVPLTVHDVSLVHQAMTGEPLPHSPLPVPDGPKSPSTDRDTDRPAPLRRSTTHPQLW